MIQTVLQLSKVHGEKLNLSYGVDVSINPVQGKKIKTSLNRTKIVIKLTSEQDRVSCSGDNWSLPGFGRKGEFLIDFCPINKTESIGIYGVRSISGGLFKINGTLSQQAYLQRGDRVCFGLNEMIVGGDSGGCFENEVDVPIRVIESDLSVLLEGATGSGKSFLAKRIHENSGRAGRFVQINIASFSESLVESELFGHVKGAFTGASVDRLGAFQAARGGTLFIDEIDSLSLGMQSKLLLFLDNLKVRAVGSHREEHCPVRLIFASGRSLRRLVDQGLMRSDFYYRLQTGFCLTLNSLKGDHKKIEEFCRKFEQENDVRMRGNLIELYKRMDWPGNYRQISGHLKKKKYLSRNKILELDELDNLLDVDCSTTVIPFDKYEPLSSMKLKYVREVFFRLDENVDRVCKVLDISPSTLRLMKKKWDFACSASLR